MSTIPFPQQPAHRPPVISRRTMLTVSAAAGLSGLAAGYVTFTRPLLKPTGTVEQRKFLGKIEELPSPGNELAKRYLPDQPWAAEANYTVRNGRSVLYFNSFEPTEDGKAIEFKPFAMLFPPKDEVADEAPLAVIGERAIVQVEGEIADITNSDPGRIVGGQMPGVVQLRGPDGLDLLGSNFHFMEGDKDPLVWSDEAVAFRQGLHSGRGTGVTLELYRVGDASTYESIAVNGLKRVTIRKDVEMELRVDGDGGGPFASLAGDEAPKDAPAETPAAEKPEPLPTRVTCAGSFTYDCYFNTATFDQDVVAARASADGGDPDSLECDTMTVVFEPATEEGKQKHATQWAKATAGTLTEDDGFQATDGELAVVRLIASAKDGPAILRSPSNEFVAYLSKLIYEAKSGVTSLTREGQPVDVRQGTSRLVSPKIIIEPTEGGGPPRLTCLDPGWLVHEEKPGETALVARWSESLHRLRGPDGLDLIRLIGQADVRQPKEEFILKADRIDLWLDPKEGEKPAEKAAAARRPFAGSGNMEPVHLLAENVAGNKVQMRSPELWADANKLDVTFAERAAPQAAPSAVETSQKEARTNLTTASRRILLASAETPVPATAQAVTSESAAPAAAPPKPKPASPIALAADKIAVVVDRSAAAQDAPAAPDRPRGGEVREVHTTGGVVVKQEREPGQDPLEIVGDRLDLFNRGEGRELVQIYGRPEAVGPDGQASKEAPALVRDQGSSLWGMNINLDRGANVAWVDGKGVLRLPVKGGAEGLLGPSGDETADAETGNPVDEPTASRQLDVHWRESMKFDGDKAVFHGTVMTRLGGDVMSCAEMEVRLTSRFDFAAAGRPAGEGGDAPRPEVAEVHCKHEVFVQGREFAAGKHVGDRQARFYELKVDQRTGDTQARGPGEISIWRKGDGNRAGLAADNSVRANSTVRRDGESWEYLKVTFQGPSEGNIKRRSTTFQDHVEVIYGPVSATGRVIDPNRPERAPAQAGWMTCDRLTLTQHAKTETSPAYSEVDAEGNVELDGQGFSGQADEVLYDESKGQYILKSYGNEVATIAKWSKDGNGQGEFAGQEIQFYPARSVAKVTKAKGGSGVQ